MPTSPRQSPIAPLPRRGLAWIDGFTGLFFILSLASALAMTRLGVLHGNDFKHLWLGAWLLGYDKSPYDPAMLFKAAHNFGIGAINPFVYLPTTGLMLRPLAALDYPVAMCLWFWINWVLAWLVVLGGPSLLRVGRPAIARLAGAAFLAGALPFFRQQTAGQMNVVTAALILWAAVALRRRRSVQCGAALALGFAWKIAPALLIAALGPLRRWRACAWGCAIAALLIILSLYIYGPEIHRQAVPVLRQMGYGQSTWASHGMDFYRDPFNQSPNALFHHLLTGNPYTQPWIKASPALANRLTMLAAAVLGGLWLVQVVRRLWRSRPQDQAPNGADVPLFFAASLAMLLLPSLMWDHYAVQALPALLWVAGHRRTAASRWRAALALALFITLTIPWMHQAQAWRHGAGILLMSLRLWPLLGLYLWLLLDPTLNADR